MTNLDLRFANEIRSGVEDAETWLEQNGDSSNPTLGDIHLLPTAVTESLHRLAVKLMREHLQRMKKQLADL